MSATTRYRECGFPFVREGSLAIRELCHYNVSKPIPPGETAIFSMCLGKDGRIYGGTGGEKAHLFVYDPFPTNDHVIDIGIIGKEKYTVGLIPLENGKIIGAANPGGIIFSYDPADDYSLLWKYECAPIKIHGPAVEGNAVTALTLDKTANLIYGLTLPDNCIFLYDHEKRESEILIKIDSKCVSPMLLADGTGSLFGALADGIIFRYDIQEKRIYNLPARLPGTKGSDFANKWEKAVINKKGVIYGGTNSGYVFSFDPAKNSVISHGKPIRDDGIRALCVGKEGKLWGIAGIRGLMSHLFSYNQNNGEMKDLGIPCVGFPKPWAGYEFDSIVTGRDGQIYMGESDRISHLFIYYPPVTEA